MTEPIPINPDMQRDNDPAMAYMELGGRFPSDLQLRWLDELAERFSDAAVCRALAMSVEDGRPDLQRASDALRMEERRAARAEREQERERLREKRARGGPRVDMDPELFRQIREAMAS